MVALVFCCFAILLRTVRMRVVPYFRVDRFDMKLVCKLTEFGIVRVCQDQTLVRWFLDK